nr:hypothetical protein CFP56_10197 [Quercus suber]
MSSKRRWRPPWPAKPRECGATWLRLSYSNPNSNIDGETGYVGKLSEEGARHSQEMHEPGSALLEKFWSEPRDDALAREMRYHRVSMRERSHKTGPQRVELGVSCDASSDHCCTVSRWICEDTHRFRRSTRPPLSVSTLQCQTITLASGRDARRNGPRARWAAAEFGTAESDSLPSRRSGCVESYSRKVAARPSLETAGLTETNRPDGSEWSRHHAIANAGLQASGQAQAQAQAQAVAAVAAGCPKAGLPSIQVKAAIHLEVRT